MAAVTQDITAEQGAALAVTFTGAGASLNGRTLRMHVRSKVGVTTTKLVASTSDGRLAVGANPYTTATLAIDADVMAAVSITLPVEYWVYDVESYTTAADVRREWSGRFTISRDVTRDTEATTETALSGAVLYSGPQSLTTAQQDQAWDNIGGDEAARDAIGAALVAGSNVTITVSDAGDTITIASSGGGGSSAWGDITGTLSAQTDLGAALALKAPLASPTLTGTPAAPTAAGATSTTQIATTAFVGGEITTHAGAADPHGDRSFATSAVSTHSGLTTGAHGITAAGAALLDDATAADQRTTLGLGTAATTAATAYEASGAVSTHNSVTTAHGISAYGATLVDDVDAATARTTLGLGTAATSASGDFATAGHNHSGVYQPSDAELTAIAGLTSAADSAPYFTGSGTAALMTVTAAGRALIDDADATAQRATLGLAIGTDVQAYDADLTTWAGITPGTGVGTALGTNVGSAGAFVTNGGALGTPSSGTMTNCTGFPTLNQNTSGYAEALKSATTTVSVSAATAPSSGQVLTATSSTAATWQTPSGGGTPAGSDTHVQYNDGGAFGGEAAFSYDKTTNTLTVSTHKSAAGEALALTATAPAATTGASVAGVAATVTAGAAVASTDTAGAAAGGDLTFTAGAAARLTSGNASAGNYIFTDSAGVGTGVGSHIHGPAGTSALPSYAFAADPDTGIYRRGANELGFVTGGSERGNISNAGAWTFAGNVVTGFSRTVGNRTSDGSEATTGSAGHITNAGATALVTRTLPSAAAGAWFQFIVMDADGLKISAASGDNIRVIDKITAAAGYISSTTIGSVVALVAVDATTWVATSIHGVWTDGTFTYDDTANTTP